MKKERIIEIIDEIDEQYINEAVLLEKPYANGEKNPASLKEKKLKINRRNLIWIAAAAILVLVMAGGAVFGAVSAEAKEYEKAAAFFEENGLSSEGLSRAEIRAVYRDITTKHFTNEKTAEVLRKSVPGFEIGQEEPTPEEMAAAWDRLVWKRTVSRRGYSYEVEVVNRKSDLWETDMLDKTILTCYLEGSRLWTVELPNVYVDGYFHIEGGTVVWGTWPVFSTGASHAWISFVDDSGEKTWRTTSLTNDSQRYEHIVCAVDNGDGTIEVISHYDYKYIGLNRFDTSGKLLSVHTLETDNYGVRNAVRTRSGYLLSLSKWDMEETNLLCEVDEKGKELDRYSITADDRDYFITDMAEFGGRTYLSCYGVPKQSNEYGRREIRDILEKLWARQNTQGEWNIPSEELTPMLRENYTAVLFRCDPDGGSPENFYSVKGSLGGKLYVNGAGYLEWDTESITSSFYSPVTSSFTLGGVCKVFQYDFDSEGSLVHQEDTGETVPYRR